ncbi:hypothetical protein CTheo_8779 [Ceratobasidium theobromae]|uniref:Uncharacterized protein n=1 Tax=Ceratobasidium theobromae TaxID=1582974 RepID=A0A5N5Q8N4_9AGAM|nr:hypothetical protein CTheo_8779 [Ceratobasidium theobromae]
MHRLAGFLGTVTNASNASPGLAGLDGSFSTHDNQPGPDGTSANLDNGNCGEGQGPSFEGTQLSLEFAEVCMDYHNIGGDMHDDVRRFSKLDPMHRDIELCILVLTLKLQTGGNTAALDFLHSQTYLTHITNRLKLVLLAPHTMFYVMRLQEWVLGNMHNQPAAWKIPLELIDNNDQWATFAAAVRVHLTTIRSQFKHKVILTALPVDFDGAVPC